jgi:hypothetical protein
MLLNLKSFVLCFKVEFENSCAEVAEVTVIDDDTLILWM